MIAAALFAVSCALGGCAGGGAASGAFAMASTAAAVPPWRSNRSTARRRRCSTAWSSVLDSESKLRNLPIVSREGGASYRVRSYLSAQVVRGKTMIAWVWDVYDNNQQRALRLSGEEAAGKAGRDAWAAADDLVLRKIAQAGLSGLTGMINGTPDAAPAPAPAAAAPRSRVRKRPSPAAGCNQRRGAGLQRPISGPVKSRIRPIFDRENGVNGLPAGPPA